MIFNVHHYILCSLTQDGEQLEKLNKNLEFVEDGLFRKLVIHSATVHDEGEYTCVLGDHECTAELTVIGMLTEIMEMDIHSQNLWTSSINSAIFPLSLLQSYYPLTLFS